MILLDRRAGPTTGTRWASVATGWPTIRRPRLRPRRWAAALVVIGVAVVATACGSGSPEGALAGKSASQIVSTSISAYHHQQSLRFVTRTVEGSQEQTQLGDVSDRAAAETVRSGKDPVVEAVLVQQVAYLQAGTQLLKSVLGLPSAAATAHAGSWISISPGDSAYQSVSSSLTPTAAIQLFVPQEPHLTVLGTTQFNGQQTVAVSGSPAATSPSGTTATVTLFVSTASPYLPVGATLVVKSTSGKVVERQASLYGRWNQKVEPVAPKNATPVSSLTS